MNVAIADVGALLVRARELCAKSEGLQSIAPTIRADALLIKAYAREVRGVRRLSGGYDTAQIARLVAGASLCDECLGRKTGLLVRRVRDVLNQFAEAVKLMTKQGRCDACLKMTVVHRLGRSRV